jgi:tetratricopeptide (TPR) repeat protein
LLALALIGCGEGGPDAHGLVALEDPVLDRLDPAVRVVLEQAREELRSAASESDSNQAEVGALYGDLGRLYQLYQLYDAAVPCYLNAATLLPADYRWPYYLGQVHRSRYELDPALRAFERVLELKPDDAPTHLALGQVHREAGRLEQAERSAKQVLAREPESGGALLLMAQLAVDRGDSLSAVERYERILELQPTATRMHQPLALAYRSLGRQEDAQAHLAQRGNGAVAVKDPLMTELFALESRATGGGDTTGAEFTRRDFAGGVAAFERGDFAMAAEIFGLAVEQDPQSVAARLNLGSALARMGRLDASLEQYEAVLRIEADHSTAQFNTAVILDQLGRSAESIEHYEAALRIDPGFGAPRFNLANTLRRAGRCTEALEHYDHLRQVDPGNAAVRAGEALCLIESGETDRARARIDEALLVLPQSRLIQQLSARTFAANPVEEIRDGDRALEIATGIVAARRDAGSLETLAMALAELGRFDEAIAAQREAVSMTEQEADPSGILDRLRDNLERYRQGKPCRDPAFV